MEMRRFTRPEVSDNFGYSWYNDGPGIENSVPTYSTSSPGAQKIQETRIALHTLKLSAPRRSLLHRVP